MANPGTHHPSGRTRRRGRTIAADGPHPIDVYVGSRIRLQRITRGLTQTDLASLVGISFQSVQKYERGENRVSASRLHEFAQALGVGEQFFFDGLAPGPSETPARAPSASEGRELSRQLTALLSIEDRRLRGLIIQLLKVLTDLGGVRVEDEPSKR